MQSEIVLAAIVMSRRVHLMGSPENERVNKMKLSKR